MYILTMHTCIRLVREWGHIVFTALSIITTSIIENRWYLMLC